MPRTAVRTRRPVPDSTALRGLGERLRKARTQAGLSQGQLGAPHFTRAYVSAVELGKIRPSVKSLEFIAAKLGKPTAYFMEEQGAEEDRRLRELAVREVTALLTRATAPKALERASQLLDSSTSPAEIGRLRLYIATARNFLSLGPQALGDLAVAERLARQLNDDRLAGAIAYQTAIALRLTGEHQRARGILESLLSRLEASPTPDPPMRVKLLKDLGAIAYDLGELDAASGYYNAALEWSKDIGDVAGLVSIYHGLALAYRGRGDLDAATGYLQRALGATEVANDLGYAATLHNALAIIAAERGHMKSAYEHVDRAIAIARVNGPAAYVPHYLNTKAECALRMDDLDTARTFAMDASSEAAASRNERAGAAARIVLADIEAKLGNLDQSSRHLKEAVAKYRAINARSELGEVFMRLSKLAQRRGLTREASDYASQAYDMTKGPSGLIGGV